MARSFDSLNVQCLFGQCEGCSSALAGPASGDAFRQYSGIGSFCPQGSANPQTLPSCSAAALTDSVRETLESHATLVNSISQITR